MDTSNNRAAGGVDPSFANNGRFVFSPDSYGMITANRLMQDPQGRIVVAATQIEGNERYAIARLNENGEPDLSFGNNGLVTGQFQPGKSSFGGVVAQTQDNKILISGYYLGALFGEWIPALARHLDTGELDTEFGEDGIVYFDFSPPETYAQPDDHLKRVSTDDSPGVGPLNLTTDLYSFKITPLPNGKLMFSGVIEAQRDVRSSHFSVLGRLNADGSLDETFGDKGYIYPKYSPNFATQHLIQPDGKILLAGHVEKRAGTEGYVYRYLPDGNIDPTFGTSGYILLEVLESGGHIKTIAAYGNNKLIVGANRHLGNGSNPWSAMLIGLTMDGAWDLDFNGGEPVDIKLGTSGFRPLLNDLVIDDDGFVLLGDMGAIALARYLLNGTPDINYGDRLGWQQHPGRASYDLLRQPDGKLLITGIGDSSEKFVARFLAD